MPYIKNNKRKQMKSALGDLSQCIDSVGDLNYVYFKLACMYIRGLGELSNDVLNSVIGVYESSKLEFYRRKVVPYEDVKIIENGDVI